ncbi:hypothetical protein STEG23_019808, partial [Scotinomys teguina]
MEENCLPHGSQASEEAREEGLGQGCSLKGIVTEGSSIFSFCLPPPAKLGIHWWKNPLGMISRTFFNMPSFLSAITPDS